MCVDIHRENALAIDFDWQARGLRLGMGRIQHTAAAKSYSARGRAFQEIPSGGHWSPPPVFGWFPQAGRLTRRSILHFIGNHIANPGAEGQSFPK